MQPTAAELDEEAPRHSALLIAGLTTFAASYLGTAVFAGVLQGTIASDCKYEAANCDRPGKLLIPIAGPWLVASELEGWTPVLGIGQALGLALTIAGAVVYANSGPDNIGPATASARSWMRLPLTAASVRGGFVVRTVLSF